MQFLHEKIWGESGLRAPVATYKLASLSFATSPSAYTRIGIPPELVTAAHSALHGFAKYECRANEGWTQARAFDTVVRALPLSARPHPDAEPTLILIALAQAYGLSFASVEHARECITSVHELVAPHFKGLTNTGRSFAMWKIVGKLFALLGAHMQCEPVPESLIKGMTTVVFSRLLRLLAGVDLSKTVQACKILRLAAGWKERPLDINDVIALAQAHQHRLDDLAELLMEDCLSHEAAQQFQESPELFDALSLAAMRELLEVWEPKDGPLLEVARYLAPDLVRKASAR